MIGFFKILSFLDDKDAAGVSRLAHCASVMDGRIECDLYLPPYIRATQCNVTVGATVLGVVDDTTGIGCAMYGEGAADFGYFFDSDIHIKNKLTVDDDIKSTLGDVVAGTISLKGHTHSIGTLHTQDGTLIATGVAAVVAGNPFPETQFTAWTTLIPQ